MDAINKKGEYKIKDKDIRKMICFVKHEKIKEINNNLKDGNN